MFGNLFNLISNKYSLEYYNKFLKVNKKSPFKEPLKEHFAAHNVDLLIRNEKYTFYKTNNKITYPDLEFNSQFNEIRKKYGNPSQYSIHQIAGHSLSVAVFKNLLLSNDNKIILYFFDEKLIEFEYILFGLNTIDYKELLHRVVVSKYLQGVEMAESDGIYVEDNEKNLIFSYWNGFDLSIKFLSGHSDTYKEAFIDFYNNVYKQKKKEIDDEFDMNYEISQVIV